MGILGFLFRAIREKVQEQSAKGDLEDKLGRKVSTHDLYSLGSHLDAAQPDAKPNVPQMPFQSTPRESSVPFGDAKPPMKTMTKLIIAAVILMVVGVVGVAGFVMIMPQATYNRLNPFTPKPSPNDFPAQIGRFTRSSEPEYWNYSSYDPLNNYFKGKYKAANTNDLDLHIWHFKTPEEAKAGLENKKKSLKSYKGYQYIADTDARFAAVWLKNGSSSVAWTDGTKLKYVSGAPQKIIYELEGLLRNAAPAEIVDVKLEEADTTNSGGTNDLSVTVVQILDDYKKDATAADKKYKGKTITVTGTVEVSEKDKKGNWMIAFMRPGSTAPKDGMVVCSFEKSQETAVSKVKKGDAVTLQGKVMMNIIGSIVLQNCSKL